MAGQGSMWLSEIRSLSSPSHNLKYLLTQVVEATALTAAGALGKFFL